MKKNKMMRMASALLVATLLSTSVIAGTFAKYTTTVSGSDKAIVAKWDVGVKGDDGVAFGEKTAATVDIFKASAVYDTKGETEQKDTDVYNPTSGDAVIAPGTYGKFTYTLSNQSDVNATYSVTYSADEKSVPLQWSLDGNNWKDDITELNVSDEAINMPSNGKNGAATEAPITIYWKWAYTDDAVVTQTDEGDTNLGTASTLAQPTATISVQFTQVD